MAAEKKSGFKKKTFKVAAINQNYAEILRGPFGRGQAHRAAKVCVRVFCVP
jgi:hypothetical protein